ncbi:hypothetical protein EG830_03215 [bacterium]|nr:hypothetical protein [bacterium]
MRGALILSLLLAGVAMGLSSCDGDDPQDDYASVIEGTYYGTVTTGSTTVPGTTELVRFTDVKVDVHISAGSRTLDIYGVKISNSGDDIYNLSYSIVGNTLDGNVEGNQLTYTLTSGALNGTFTGTR